jgi:hypothetical protein
MKKPPDDIRCPVCGSPPLFYLNVANIPQLDCTLPRHEIRMSESTVRRLFRSWRKAFSCHAPGEKG